jgi:hypothetical protein
MNNDRIKLPAQEWLGYDPERGDIHGYTFEQMREFAEVIVRECNMAVLGVPCYYKGSYSHIEESTINDCARAVLEHFGLEERP